MMTLPWGRAVSFRNPFTQIAATTSCFPERYSGSIAQLAPIDLERFPSCSHRTECGSICDHTWHSLKPPNMQDLLSHARCSCPLHSMPRLGHVLVQLARKWPHMEHIKSAILSSWAPWSDSFPSNESCDDEFSQTGGPDV